MAEIPEYFAKERMETSRLPRAPAGIADVGAGIEALGLVGFGRILSGISSDALQNLITVRSEAQELEGTSQWERAHTEFFTNLAKDQDFENYGEKYKDFAKSLRRQVLKKGLTGTARQNLEAYMENQQVGQEKRVAAAFLAKQRDYGRVSTFQSVINFEQAGDFDGAMSAINHARNAGFMSTEEAFARKQKVQANITTYQKQALLETVHEAAKLMPYTEAIGYLNDLTNITSAERNDLISRRKRQNEIETASHNDSVYWNTLRKLTKDRDSISDDELEALVKPDSLSVDDWKEFTELKKPEGLLSKPSVKTALTLFDNLKTIGAYVGKPPAEMTIEEQRENIQTWADIKNDFIKWVQDNPGATEDQIERKQKALVEPEREETKLHWWTRFWRKKKGRQLFGLVLSEEELIAERKKKIPAEISAKERASRKARIRELVVPLNLKYKTRLQPSLLDNTSDEFFDVWSKLSDDQKLKTLRALEGGYTEREILTALGK